MVSFENVDTDAHISTISGFQTELKGSRKSGHDDDAHSLLVTSLQTDMDPFLVPFERTISEQWGRKVITTTAYRFEDLSTRTHDPSASSFRIVCSRDREEKQHPPNLWNC
jgi:hypothetical protein